MHIYNIYIETLHVTAANAVVPKRSAFVLNNDILFYI